MATAVEPPNLIIDELEALAGRAWPA